MCVMCVGVCVCCVCLILPFLNICFKFHFYSLGVTSRSSAQIFSTHQHLLGIRPKSVDFGSFFTSQSKSLQTLQNQRIHFFWRPLFTFGATCPHVLIKSTPRKFHVLLQIFCRTTRFSQGRTVAWSSNQHLNCAYK